MFFSKNLIKNNKIIKNFLNYSFKNNNREKFFTCNYSKNLISNDRKRFSKILIANRGEIACRVIESAKKQGIQTVAVYSRQDANSRHVELADESYFIGESEASASYLVKEKILEVAKKTNSEAIHPGYGFLSENELFSDQCEQSGIKFIGPPSSAIKDMGSKSASKNIMIEAGVNCVPGYHGEDQSIEKLKEEAEKISYPLLIKAVLGGGGKGMRIVHHKDELEESILACRREALNSFSDDRVLLEKYIEKPRHVEIQVFADQFGECVYLFERDCSLQRRYQKVIEEAPAPNLSDELRKQIGETAVRAAKAVGYEGAGTVEFIFDTRDQSYYFMEMNTRLQVEHPVTEMITGQDLVQWQLDVAAGNPLPKSQNQLVSTGHSFEARIYAENPKRGFIPLSGHLNYLEYPQTDPKHVRVDTGVRSGDEVSVHYDPMIAKLIVWDENRTLALQRLRHSLDRFNVSGLSTNIEFLKKCCDHENFKKADVETHFIDRFEKQLLPDDDESQSNPIAIGSCALSLILFNQAQHQIKSKHSQQYNRFRVNLNSIEPITLLTRENSIPIQCFVQHNPQNNNYTLILPKNTNDDENVNTLENVQSRLITSDDQLNNDYDFIDLSGSLINPTSSLSDNKNGVFHFDVNYQINQTNVKGKFIYSNRTNSIDVFDQNGENYSFDLPTQQFSDDDSNSKSSLFAPMPGKINKVLVEPDQEVTAGTPLIIMEAMKMEHVITAPKDGKIKAVNCSNDSIVDEKTPLVTFYDDDDETDE